MYPYEYAYITYIHIYTYGCIHVYIDTDLM